MVEKLPRSAARSRCAASRSWIEAAVTTTASSRPFTSTARCRLTPFVFLAPSQPRLDRGTVSAAGTVCESRMRCHAPLRAQRAKTAYTVPAGGNSTGSCRHAIPPRTMYRMASTITRRQFFSGRPPRPAVLPGAGNSGSRIAYSASVTDDEYTAQPCPPAAWGGHDGHGEIGDDGIVSSWSGRGLGNHRPNQEPTPSVLREAHARPSRVLKHSL